MLQVNITLILTDKKNKKISRVIKKATDKLIEMSNEDGEYESYNTISSESLDYVAIAMAISENTEFDYNRAVENVLSYGFDDGTFAHSYEEKGKQGNAMATEQALLFMVSMKMASKGLGRLFTAEGIDLVVNEGKTFEDGMDSDDKKTKENVSDNSVKKTETDGRNSGGKAWQGLFVIELLFCSLLLLCVFALLFYLHARKRKQKTKLK